MRQGWGCGLDPDNTGPQPTIWFSECFTERLKRPSLDQAPPASADRNRLWGAHGADWELGFPGTKECDWCASDLGLALCGEGLSSIC